MMMMMLTVMMMMMAGVMMMTVMMMVMMMILAMMMVMMMVMMMIELRHYVLAANPNTASPRMRSHQRHETDAIESGASNHNYVRRMCPTPRLP